MRGLPHLSFHPHSLCCSPERLVTLPAETWVRRMGSKSELAGPPPRTLVLAVESTVGWAAQRPWDTGRGRPADGYGVWARGADKQAGVSAAAEEEV